MRIGKYVISFHWPIRIRRAFSRAPMFVALDADYRSIAVPGYSIDEMDSFG